MSQNVIFANTVSFDPSSKTASEIHRFLENCLTPLKFAKDAEGYVVSPVGSAFSPRLDSKGKAVRSNDWDGQIDIDEVVRRFPPTFEHLSLAQQVKVLNDPDKLRCEIARVSKKKFASWLQKQGVESKISGITVHAAVPIGTKVYQADLELVKDRNAVRWFHRHQIPTGSKFKGVHKHVFLRELARSKNKLWSPWEGLYSRNESGVKDQFISNQRDVIVEQLFGIRSSAHVMDCIENMMTSLDSHVAQQLLDQAKQDHSWK